MKKKLLILCLILSFLLTFSCSNTASPAGSDAPDVQNPAPVTKKNPNTFTVSSTIDKKYYCAKIDLSEKTPHIIYANFENEPCTIKKECVVFPKDYIRFNKDDIKLTSCETVFGSFYENTEFPCKWNGTETSISKVAIGFAKDQASSKQYILLKFVTNLTDKIEKDKVWSATFLATVENNSRNACNIKDIILFEKTLMEK